MKNRLCCYIPNFTQKYIQYTIIYGSIFYLIGYLWSFRGYGTYKNGINKRMWKNEIA